MPVQQVRYDDGEIHPYKAVILDQLQEGRGNNPLFREEILEETGDDLSKQAVHYHLADLLEDGHIRRVAQGLYELVSDPRDEDDGPD